MNNKVVGIAAFIGGALIGSFATWSITKTKYERIMQEEADAFREHIYKSTKEPVAEEVKEEEHVEEDDDPFTKEEVDQYKKMLKDLKYVNQHEEKGEFTFDRPYVITPEEYGEHDDYDVVSLDYYADDVLVDDMGDVVEKDLVEEMLGTDFKNRFGEYDANAVFVRDDERQIDYEVLRDPHPFYADESPSE